MLTPVRAVTHLARSAERAALTASDTVVAVGLRTRARMRLSITPSLVTGHARRARIMVPDLRIGGLHVAEVDVRADHLWIPARWPARVRADRVVVVVHVTEAALHRWTRANALPLRLTLRHGSIAAGTGIAGRRLGELEIDLHLDGGRLRLVPRRVSILGVAVHTASAAMLAVALPLPPLPWHAKLVAVAPVDGAIDVAFELTDLDEPLTVDRLRWAALAMRRRSEPAPIATRDRRPPAVGITA